MSSDMPRFSVAYEVETYWDDIEDNVVSYLSIWELKDYDSRRMTLKQTIFLDRESDLIHFKCESTRFHVSMAEAYTSFKRYHVMANPSR